MKNKDLMQDVVERWGEDSRLDMIVEKSTLLATAIQKLKRSDRKEDHQAYADSYSEVCERIAEVKLIIEEAEFLFNSDEINNHYKNKIQQLTLDLNTY